MKWAATSEQHSPGGINSKRKQWWEEWSWPQGTGPVQNMLAIMVMECSAVPSKAYCKWQSFVVFGAWLQERGMAGMERPGLHAEWLEGWGWLHPAQTPTGHQQARTKGS